MQTPSALDFGFLNAAPTAPNGAEMATRSTQEAAPEAAKGPSFFKTLDRAINPHREPEASHAAHTATSQKATRAASENSASAAKVPERARHDKAGDDENQDGDQIDDRLGAMAQSYQGFAISYPIQKIARGLPPEVQNNLKAHGLWNDKIQFIAKPNATLLAMAQIQQQAKGLVQKQGAIVVPIEKFMNSLKNELGIDRQQLLAAFVALKPGQLAQTPAQTLPIIIKNLNLDPKSETQALKIAGRLLAELNQAAANMAKPQMTPQMTAQMPLEAVAFSGQAAASSALPVTYTPPTAQAAQTVQPAQAMQAAQAVQAAQPPQVVQPHDLHYDLLKAQAQQAAASPAPQTQTAQTLMPQTFAPVSAQVSAAMMPAKKAAGGHRFGADDDAGKGGPALQNAVTEAAMARAHAQKSDATANFSQALDTAGEPAVGMAGTASASIHRHETVQALINNAQLLAHRGGGEMRMSLKPEHMGEIQLRVAMNGDRVNVHLVTDKPDVKHWFEQNVQDLKQGLATHHLSIEKLDVSLNQKNFGGFDQRQSDQQFAARDFTQNAGQHRQNQERRGQYFEAEQLANRAHAAAGARARSFSSVTAGMARPRFHAGGRLSVMA